MPRVEVYEDAAAEYRWRKVADNGEIASVAGESFTRREDARRSAIAENPEVDPDLIAYAEEDGS